MCPKSRRLSCSGQQRNCAVLQDAYLCCHPCINTSTLKLRMADAIDVLIPALAHAPTYVDLPVYEPQT